MPMFKLNRTYALRTMYGHIINFIKDEPTHVPPIAVKDAVAIGAECIDGEVNVLEDEAAPIQLSHDELKSKLFEAFKAVVLKNDPDDFTAQGVPKVNVIEATLGLKVTKVEVIDAWQAYRSGEEE